MRDGRDRCRRPGARRPCAAPSRGPGGRATAAAADRRGARGALLRVRSSPRWSAESSDDDWRAVAASEDNPYHGGARTDARLAWSGPGADRARRAQPGHRKPSWNLSEKTVRNERLQHLSTSSRSLIGSQAIVRAREAATGPRPYELTPEHPQAAREGRPSAPEAMDVLAPTIKRPGASTSAPASPGLEPRPMKPLPVLNGAPGAPLLTLEDHPSLQGEVRALAAERDAVILAHNYQVPEVQDVGRLRRRLARALAARPPATDADAIVFCGVHFMAETASILCPEKSVLIPDVDAGCSLADSITAEQLRAWKAEHPGAIVVMYVNTTAEVKAETDYCVHVLERGRRRRAHPPRARAGHRDPVRARHVPRRLRREDARRRKMHVWDGECHVHAGIRPGDIDAVRAAHPGADFLIHPECGCSTSVMEYVAAGDVDVRGRAHALDRRDARLRAQRRGGGARRSSPPRPGCSTRCARRRPDVDFIAANERAELPLHEDDHAAEAARRAARRARRGQGARGRSPSAPACRSSAWSRSRSGSASELRPPSAAASCRRGDRALALVRHGASAADGPRRALSSCWRARATPLAPEGVEQARAGRRPPRRAAAGRDLRHAAAPHRADRRAARSRRPASSPRWCPSCARCTSGSGRERELRIRAAHGDPLLARVISAERWRRDARRAESMEAVAERVARRHRARRRGDRERGARPRSFVHGGVIGEACRQATASRRFAFVYADTARSRASSSCPTAAGCCAASTHRPPDRYCALRSSRIRRGHRRGAPFGRSRSRPGSRTCRAILAPLTTPITSSSTDWGIEGAHYHGRGRLPGGRGDLDGALGEGRAGARRVDRLPARRVVLVLGRLVAEGGRARAPVEARVGRRGRGSRREDREHPVVHRRAAGVRRHRGAAGLALSNSSAVCGPTHATASSSVDAAGDRGDLVEGDGVERGDRAVGVDVLAEDDRLLGGVAGDGVGVLEGEHAPRRRRRRGRARPPPRSARRSRSSPTISRMRL